MKPERNGWRDEDLSLRHKCYGYNCPAVDIDFLLTEYNHEEPVAIIEHKHEKAGQQNLTAPSYKALSRLGERANIPAFFCRYSDGFTEWTVTPLNDIADRMLTGQRRAVKMTEMQYVAFLYKLRGCELPSIITAQDIQRNFERYKQDLEQRRERSNHERHNNHL